MLELKIRASALGKIMTVPKAKGAVLSETAKTYLKQLWIENNFGRYKEFSSKYTDKGNENEEQGITLVSRHFGELFVKNEKNFSNDFLTGTPDVIHEDMILDNKCSWDIFTFMDSDMTTLYEWQGRAYMELTGCTKFKLCYTLTDASERIIFEEARRLSYRADESVTLEEIIEGVRSQLTYKDIPREKKVKVFDLTHDPELIEQAYEKIIHARTFYNSLAL